MRGTASLDAAKAPNDLQPDAAEPAAEDDPKALPAGERSNASASAGESIPEALRAIEAAKPGFLAKLIETFSATSAEYLGVLREAVAQHEPETAAEAAHPLKSSSAQLGLTGLSALLSEMESLARSGSLDGAAELLERIESEYDGGLEILAAHRSGVGHVR